MLVNTPIPNPQNEQNNTLRPKKWPEYIGQERAKKTLRIMIDAAKKRGDVLDHVLLYGSPGFGKTTLSYIIANDMNVNIHVSSGPAMRKSGDLASILSNLSDGDILFIDEMHRLNKICEEMIYPAMEDYKLDLVVGKGPMAQNMTISLPKFTLIGATTKFSLLTPPLRSRFGATFQLKPYSISELETIISQSAKKLDIEIDKSAINLIAKCSRLTPRTANHLLKRVRDYTQSNNGKKITIQDVDKTLDLLGIDPMGLGPEDRKLLSVIDEIFNGGPVGIQTLAAATSEDEQCITDVYEPYLMQVGFLERTAKGRKLTKIGKDYLKGKI